jgi:carboxypeptidase C (cathepsin A)
VAALSRLLAERHGINLNRAILISPALRTDLADPQYDIIGPMTLLPAQAAIAAQHGLSTISNDAAGYRAAEAYALGDYATGLATLGRATPEQQAAFYAKVGGLIGLPPALVARHQGRISDQVFAGSLLQARGQVIDRYDGTLVSDNPTPGEQGLGVLDRSLTVLGGVLLAPFMDYVRTDLGYVSDRAYIPLNLEVNMAWDRKSDRGGPDDLAVALAQNLDLKALVVHGYQDLTTPYMLTRYVLEQTARARGARQRLYFGTYPGGHMFYLRQQSRAELAADVQGFFEDKH